MLKDKVKQFHKIAWAEKSIDGLADFVAPAVAIRSPLQQTTGLEALQAIFKKWHQAFPDLDVTYLQMVEEGQTVVVHWRAQGTHQAAFESYKPTGHPIVYEGVTFYTFDDSGLISDYSALVDMKTLFEQLSG